MAPQATRISIVFGCLVFAFAGVRTLIVPDSFGKTGHFRQAALGAIAAHPPKFEGKQPCIDCHANNTPHTDKGVSCETCHGPGAAHSKDFDSSKLVVDKTRNACGRCHAMNTARRSTFPQVDMAEHHGSQRCVECHNIHPEVPGKPIGDLKPAGIPKDEADAKPTAPVKPGAPAAATPPAKDAKAAGDVKAAPSKVVPTEKPKDAKPAVEAPKPTATAPKPTATAAKPDATPAKQGSKK